MVDTQDMNNATPAANSRLQRVLSEFAPVLVLLLLWFVFFWRVFTPVQEDRVIFNQDGDFILHFYSPIAYQVERVFRGEIPLWNAYNYGGEPSAANIQNGTFYIPRYILAALTGGGGFTIARYQFEVAVHYLIASVTFYAFLRILLRRKMIPVIGAVMFAYSGYATGYAMLQASTIETEAWFPLALLGIYLSVTLPAWRIRGVQIGAVAVALILTAGRPQAALYLLYAALGYLAVIGWQHRLQLGSLAWRALAIFGLGGGLAMVQLLPMAQFASRSFRIGDYDFVDKASGFLPGDIIGLVWPSANGPWSPLYIGIVGLLLAAGTLMRRKSIMEWYWIALGILALFLSLGAHTIVFSIFYVFVPGFSLFRNQERMAAQVTFALIMLAVYQLHYLWRDNTFNVPQAYRRAVYGAAGAFIGVFAISSLLYALHLLPLEGAQLINIFAFSALIAGCFAACLSLSPTEPRALFFAAASILLLVATDTFTIGTRSSNFVPDRAENQIALEPLLQQFRIPSGAVQWRVDGAGGLQGRSAYFQIPDIYGVGALSLNTIEQLHTLPVDRKWEALAVRYVMTTDDPPASIVPMTLLAYGRNYTGEEYQLLELDNPRPMAHLVYDYRQAEGSPLFARQIMADTLVDLRNMGVTLNPLPMELPGERPALSEVADFQMITPEQIEMSVSTSENALLTVSVINYPGWRATINGQPAEIVDNYSGLIGIPLPPGEEMQVVLRYIDDRVTQGALITVSALMVLVLLSLLPIPKGGAISHD